MNKLMTAVALAIALPAAANAQSAPAPAPKAEQAHKTTDCKCCKDMAKGHEGHQMPSGAGGHSGHGNAQPGTNAPHADHQQ